MPRSVRVRRIAACAGPQQAASATSAASQQRHTGRPVDGSVNTDTATQPQRAQVQHNKHNKHNRHTVIYHDQPLALARLNKYGQGEATQVDLPWTRQRQFRLQGSYRHDGTAEHGTEAPTHKHIQARLQQPVPSNQRPPTSRTPSPTRLRKCRSLTAHTGVTRHNAHHRHIHRFPARMTTEPRSRATAATTASSSPLSACDQ